MIKECTICGKVFDARGSSITCSKECRTTRTVTIDRERKREYNQRPEVIKLYHERYAERRKNRIQVTNECKVCGNVYHVGRGLAHTCSKECASINKSNVAREYRQRPEVKERNLKRQQRKYESTPSVRERRRILNHKYYHKLGGKERNRVNEAKRNQLKNILAIQAIGKETNA